MAGKPAPKAKEESSSYGFKLTGSQWERTFNKKRVISLLKQVPELELKRKPLKRSRTRSTSIVESGRQAGL